MNNKVTKWIVDVAMKVGAIGLVIVGGAVLIKLFAFNLLLAVFATSMVLLLGSMAVRDVFDEQEHNLVMEQIIMKEK